MGMATFPVPRELKDKSGEAVSSCGSYTQLSDWLSDTPRKRQRNVASGSEIGISPAYRPSQDASVVRDKVTAPYQTIGTADISVQDSLRKERSVFWEDHMALDPWKGLSAHRPVGNINQLHKVVYGRRQKMRNSLNARSSRRRSSVQTRCLDAISPRIVQ